MKSGSVSTPMRILLFAPGFAPYAASENIVNSKLVLAFRDRGWEVDVISRADTDYYGSSWCEPWLPLKELTHEVRFPFGTGGRRVLERAADSLTMGHPVEGVRWAREAYRTALRLHESKPYRVIISRSTPDVAHLPALKLSRSHRVPWIANWNDPTAHRMPPPYGGGPGARVGYFDERYLRQVAGAATLHSYPCERLRRYMDRYLGIPERQSTVIPHIGGHFPLPAEPREAVFTLCHAGHLDRMRSPDTFLEGLARFIGDDPERKQVRFVNIGLDNAALRERAEQFGVGGNLQITGSLSYLETLARLRSSSVLVVIEAPCSEGIFLPSKLVDYLQTGRPVLAVSPRVGTLSDLMARQGMAVDCLSAQAVAQTIEKCYQAWRQGTLDTEFGSDRLYRQFAPETVVGQYQEIFARLGCL